MHSPNCCLGRGEVGRRIGRNEKVRAKLKQMHCPPRTTTLAHGRDIIKRLQDKNAFTPSTLLSIPYVTVTLDVGYAYTHRPDGVRGHILHNVFPLTSGGKVALNCGHILHKVFPLTSRGKVELNRLMQLPRFKATFPPILREKY